MFGARVGRGVGTDPFTGRCATVDSHRYLRVGDVCAGEGGRDFTYRRAHWLTRWAADWRTLIEGRLTLAGHQAAGGSHAASLEEYLSVAYTIQVEQLTLLVAGGGGNLSDAMDLFHAALDEPLPGELSAEAMELKRRNRIAKENERALSALMGVAALPTAGGQ